MVSATALIYGLSSLLLLTLGGIVVSRAPKDRGHRLFGLFTLSMVAWLASLYLYYHTTNPQFLTLLGRLNFAFIVLAVSSGYAFVLELVGRRSRLERLLAAETLVLAAIAAFTPLISGAEMLNAHGEPITHFGVLFPLLVVHLGACIVMALAALFQALQEASAARRAQLQIVLEGLLLTAITAGTTNLVLPFAFGYFGLQEAGGLSVIAMIGAFAYAIAYQHLFDIRIVVKRTVIFTALIGSLIGLYGALALLATQVLRRDPIRADEFLFNLLAVTAVGLTSEPLRRWIAARTDHWLFQKDYEQQAIVGSLNQELSQAFDLEQSLQMVMDTTRKTLHVNHVISYVFEGGADGTHIQKKVLSNGLQSSPKLFLSEDDHVISYFDKHPGLAEVSELASATSEGGGTASTTPLSVSYQKLRMLGTAAALPLHQGKQLLGLMLVSDKRSGDRFTQRDIAFLNLLVGPTLAAIQKAKLYEGNQLKTEFVSIAAHELLTPITGIEGYLSMVLDEGMGTVDSRARGYLDKVYGSAKRLAALVRDLLSVSRIESGRVKIEAVALDLNAVIHDAIDQVIPTATAKDLKVTFEANTSLPPVLADANRLMEVLINLIGNAVKYTPKGSVSISTSSSSRFVDVAVRDTGLGISFEAQKHLFEKFYRVQAPETATIPGTGLGLYVTKSIVEKMGGTIWVSSTPGAGSTFTFTVPRAPHK